jgi:hypothetical protein
MKRIGIAVILAAVMILTACLAPIGSDIARKPPPGRSETINKPGDFINALRDPGVATILIMDPSLALNLSGDFSINGDKTIFGSGSNILNTSGNCLNVNGNIIFGAIQITANSMNVSALTVGAGKTLTLNSGASLILNDGSGKVELGSNAKIVVEKDSTIDDKAVDGGQLWGGNGSLEIKAGGTGKVGGVTVIGESGILEPIDSGSIVLTQDSYTLNGTVNMNSSRSVAADETLAVSGGANLIVKSGAELILNSGAIINLAGSIIVETGGTISDEAEDGGQVWNSGSSGSITILSGGTGKIGGDTIVGNDGGAPLQLGADSSFTLTKNVYTINSGNLTVNGTFGLSEGYSLTVADNTTLNIADGAVLQIDDGKLKGVSASSTLIINSGGRVVISEFSTDMTAGTYHWNGSKWLQ